LRIGAIEKKEVGVAEEQLKKKKKKKN